MDQILQFFPVMGISNKLQGSISNARGTFEPKTPTGSNLEPQNFGQKRDMGGQKIGENFFPAIFVDRPIKPLGKIFRTQKTD